MPRKRASAIPSAEKVARLAAENRKLRAENAILRAKLESFPKRTVGKHDEESE